MTRQNGCFLGVLQLRGEEGREGDVPQGAGREGASKAGPEATAWDARATLCTLRVCLLGTAAVVQGVVGAAVGCGIG